MNVYNPFQEILSLKSTVFFDTEYHRVGKFSIFAMFFGCSNLCKSPTVIIITVNIFTTIADIKTKCIRPLFHFQPYRVASWQGGDAATV